MTDLLPCQIEAVSPDLIRAISDLRDHPILQTHGGTNFDCRECRIWDHINAAFGEAVGEPIAALKAAQPNMLVDALEERIVSADLGHVITPRLLGFESHASEGYSEAIAKIVSRINDKARAALKAVKP